MREGLPGLPADRLSLACTHYATNKTERYYYLYAFPRADLRLAAALSGTLPQPGRYWQK
jgi:hypothetical protein